MLYLIHPFLNKLLHDLNKNVYQYLILLLVLCWSIIPTLTTQLFESNSLLWFITLYVIAGYAKIYGFNERLKSKHYFFLFLIVLVCSYLISVSFLVLGTKRNELAVHAIDFFGMERFPILLMALFLFMTFAKLKIKYNKWINVIASATFGVYLIHDSSYIRYYIWWNLCTGIEMVRKVLLERPYIIFVNKYVNLLINPLNKIYELSNKIFE